MIKITLKLIIICFLFVSCAKSTIGNETSELQREVDSIVSLIIKQDVVGLVNKLPDRVKIEVGHNLYITKDDVVNDFNKKKFIYASLFDTDLYRLLSRNESSSTLMSIKDQLSYYKNIQIYKVKIIQEKPIRIYRVLLTWPDRGENVSSQFDRIDFYRIGNKWFLRSLYFEIY